MAKEYRERRPDVSMDTLEKYFHNLYRARPDFVVAEGQLVPQVNALYALTASGLFAQLLRFEAKSGVTQVLGLSELIESALQIVGADAAGAAAPGKTLPAGIANDTILQPPPYHGKPLDIAIALLDRMQAGGFSRADPSLSGHKKLPPERPTIDVECARIRSR